MKKLIFAISLLFISNSAQAASLDDIYRDLVRSDNEGYLPLFVKNRNAPEFLDTQKVKDIPSAKADENQPDPIKLTNERKIREEKAKQEQKNWEDALEAIRTNNVTPKDLSEVEKKVALDDPKAVEIYAWMLARGIGVEQDLNKAFDMYQKAAVLGVPNAIKNAYEVYQSMKPAQKALAKPLEIEAEE